MTKASGVETLLVVRLLVAGDGALSISSLIEHVRRMLESTGKLSVGRLAAQWASRDSATPTHGRKIVETREVADELYVCMEMFRLATEETHIVPGGGVSADDQWLVDLLVGRRQSIGGHNH